MKKFRVLFRRFKSVNWQRSFYLETAEKAESLVAILTEQGYIAVIAKA